MAHLVDCWTEVSTVEVDDLAHTEECAVRLPLVSIFCLYIHI